MQIRLTEPNRVGLEAAVAKSRRTITLESNIAIEQYLAQHRAELKRGERMPKGRKL